MNFNTNTTDRIPSRNPIKVVEIFKLSDFDVQDNVIIFEEGTTYFLKNQILHTGTIDISDIPIFSPAVITAGQETSNSLVSLGSGGAFFINSDPSKQTGLVLDNITIALGAGDRAFAHIETTNHIDGIIGIRNLTAIGFAPGTVFKNIAVSIREFSNWADSGRIDFIDSNVTFDESFITNFIDSNDYIFRVLTANPAIATRALFNNNGLSSHPNEAFFFIHSNLSPSSEILITRLHTNLFSPGTGSIFGEETGSITSMADAGFGNITVSAPGHNGEEGDKLTHTGFTDSNYNGDFIISNVVDSVSYEITATFGATDTGTWTNKSLDQTDSKIISQNNSLINLKTSMTLAEARTNGPVTVSGTGNQNTFVPVQSAAPVIGEWIEDQASERISVDPATGVQTYEGVVDTALDLKYKIIATPTTGPNQVVEFAIFINSIKQEKTMVEVDMANINTATYIGGIFNVSTGDTLHLYKNNKTNENETDVDATILTRAL